MPSRLVLMPLIPFWRPAIPIIWCTKIMAKAVGLERPEAALFFITLSFRPFLYAGKRPRAMCQLQPIFFARVDGLRRVRRSPSSINA